MSGSSWDKSAATLALMNGNYRGASMPSADNTNRSIRGGEPPEFKTFEVAGYRFKVLYDYLTASSDQERDVLQIAPHWPTLDSPRTDKPQPHHLDGPTARG